MVKSRKQMVLVWVFFLAFLQACSQKKEEIMSLQNPDITANNIVEKLANEVKHYPKESIYFISYSQNYCFFEVLVNDIPVFKDFTNPGGTSAFDINHVILKSGTQKVTFRMYPLGRMEDGSNRVFNTFIDKTEQTFKVEQLDHKFPNDKGIIIKEYRTPVIPNPNQNFTDSIFIATGKEYYEGSFTFEAEVPYKIKGWSDSQDLRKIDPKELENKVLQFYENSKKIFQDKNIDGISRLNYNGMYTQFISEYADKDEIKYGWNNLLETIQNPTFTMQPIKNYKMVFYAEGKLVALEQNSMDSKYRGMSALWATLKEGKTEMGYENYHMLHIPKGKTELEVAR